MQNSCCQPGSVETPVQANAEHEVWFNVIARKKCGRYDLLNQLYQAKERSHTHSRSICATCEACGSPHARITRRLEQPIAMPAIFCRPVHHSSGGRRPWRLRRPRTATQIRRLQDTLGPRVKSQGSYSSQADPLCICAALGGGGGSEPRCRSDSGRFWQFRLAGRARGADSL